MLLSVAKLLSCHSSVVLTSQELSIYFIGSGSDRIRVDVYFTAAMMYVFVMGLKVCSNISLQNLQVRSVMT